MARFCLSFLWEPRPEPWRFPARNRLISGSSLGVFVIESPIDSGSLITAREAGEQGRDVFAIPGPIGFGHNTGCHKLIQDGAKLVETVDDILSELGVLTLRRPGQERLCPFPRQPPARAAQTVGPAHAPAPSGGRHDRRKRPDGGASHRHYDPAGNARPGKARPRKCLCACALEAAKHGIISMNTSLARKRRTREHIIADLSVNYVERQALLCGHTIERVVHATRMANQRRETFVFKSKPLTNCKLTERAAVSNFA